MGKRARILLLLLLLALPAVLWPAMAMGEPSSSTTFSLWDYNLYPAEENSSLWDSWGRAPDAGGCGGPAISTAGAFAPGGYEQSVGLCVAQCATYYFLWTDNPAWNNFEYLCQVKADTMVEKVIEQLKWANKVKGGISPEEFVQRLATVGVCKVLLDKFLAPQVEACRQECNAHMTAYAPNINVTSQFSNVHTPGLVYNEDEQKLYIAVQNDGYVPAENIHIEVNTGHTDDPQHANLSLEPILYQTDIPEMAPVPRRRTTHAINAPFEWRTSIHFEPEPDQYNIVTIVADGGQNIPEVNEGDNYYKLVLDYLPKPKEFRLSNLDIEPNFYLTMGSLQNYTIRFDVQNVGEVGGRAEVYMQTGAAPDYGEVIESDDFYMGGGARKNLAWPISVDVSQGNPGGTKRAYYSLKVEDNDGVLHDELLVAIPLMAGAVSGYVHDKEGNPVSGAVITAGGLSAESNENGSYYLSGLSVLGQVTVTASSQRFNQTASREINLSYNPTEWFYADSLNITGVDFVLSDADGALKLIVKDKQTGDLLDGVSYTVSLPPQSFEGEMNGWTVLTGLSPGNYYVTASRINYKTATAHVEVITSQVVSKTLELEPFNRRLDDDGLTIGQPELLWEKPYGMVYGAAASKNGELLVVYAGFNDQQNSGTLYFIDPLTGNERAVVPHLTPKGMHEHALGMAYDGNPTVFNLHQYTPGVSGPGTLYLYSPDGGLLGQLPAKEGIRPYVSVSPDGAFFYTWGLFDRNLTEIPAYNASYTQQTYVTAEHIAFTPRNAIVGQCPEAEMNFPCRYSFKEQVLEPFPDAGLPLRNYDFGAENDKAKLFVSDPGVSYQYGAGRLFFTPEMLEGPGMNIICNHGASLSVGGSVAMLITSCGAKMLKIFDSNGSDLTPKNISSVILVSANEKGLFYLVQKSSSFAYYRVGSYSGQSGSSSSSSTNPPERFPTVYPTVHPTLPPPDFPTGSPNGFPTIPPPDRPTNYPTDVPTTLPTGFPTLSPTDIPTAMPSPPYPTPTGSAASGGDSGGGILSHLRDFLRGIIFGN